MSRVASALSFLCLSSCRHAAVTSHAVTHLASGTASASPAGNTLVVPQATGRIRPDGELDELAWHDAALTGPFTDLATHDHARPYSDARLLYDDRFVYLVLYAADEDIRTPAHVLHTGSLANFDAFVVRVQRAHGDVFQLELGADGSRIERRFGSGEDSAWTSRAIVGVDRDGSVNDPSDEDEEWIVEAALPWTSFGLQPYESFMLSVSRCDTLKDHRRICSAWGGAPSNAPEGNVSFAR